MQLLCAALYFILQTAGPHFLTIAEIWNNDFVLMFWTGTPNSWIRRGNRWSWRQIKSIHLVSCELLLSVSLANSWKVGSSNPYSSRQWRSEPELVYTSMKLETSWLKSFPLHLKKQKKLVLSYLFKTRLIKLLDLKLKSQVNNNAIKRVYFLKFFRVMKLHILQFVSRQV